MASGAVGVRLLEHGAKKQAAWFTRACEVSEWECATRPGGAGNARGGDSALISGGAAPRTGRRRHDATSVRRASPPPGRRCQCRAQSAPPQAPPASRGTWSHGTRDTPPPDVFSGRCLAGGEAEGEGPLYPVIIIPHNFAGMRSLIFRLLGRRSRCPCCESARRITQSANFRHNSPLRKAASRPASRFRTAMAEIVKLISSDKESFDVPAEVARCVWRQQAPSPCVACLTHQRVTAPLAA